MDDSKEFEDTLSAMQSVGMKKAQISSVLTLVAAVLHIGNLKFQPLQVEGAEGSKIGKSDALDKFCELTQLDKATVLHVLTYRELQTMAPGGKIDTYQVTNPRPCEGPSTTFKTYLPPTFPATSSPLFPPSVRLNEQWSAEQSLLSILYL